MFGLMAFMGGLGSGFRAQGGKGVRFRDVGGPGQAQGSRLPLGAAELR